MPSTKYELVWAAAFALEFKAFRDTTFDNSAAADAENAKWAKRRADRTVEALLAAEQADEKEKTT